VVPRKKTSASYNIVITMDPISIAASISSLIVGSTKIVQLANNVRQQYANSELLMASVAAECSTVTVALAQLHSALQSRNERSWKRDGKEDVLKSVEAVSVACSLTLSVLEKYMVGMVKAKEDEDEPESSRNDVQLTRREKMRVLWNDEEITRLLSQMRGYQSSLGLLLNVVQWYVWILVAEVSSYLFLRFCLLQSLIKHSQSDSEIRSLLIDNKIAMGLILRALNNLDIDSISLSGVTLQIEDAFGNNDIEKSQRFEAIEDETLPSSNLLEHSPAARVESSHTTEDDLHDNNSNMNVSKEALIFDDSSSKANTFDTILAEQPRQNSDKKKSRNKPSISMFFDSIKIKRKQGSSSATSSAQVDTLEVGTSTPSIEIDGVQITTNAPVERIK
jgi:hypothetical protein